MTEQLTGYEASSVEEVEAVLDDSPADAEEVYLRTIGHSERSIAAVAAKRAGSGGGGSTPDLAAVLSEGNDAGGKGIVMELASDAETGFQITAAGAQEDRDNPVLALVAQTDEGDISVLSIFDPGASALLYIRPDPQSGVDGLSVESPAGNRVLATSLGEGDVTIIDRLLIRADGGDDATSPHDLIATERASRLVIPPDDQPDPYPGGVFRVLYGGAVVTAQNYEPPDAQLQPHQLATWFDSTNGAAKAMFKGKTADGTVVTGELPLAP